MISCALAGVLWLQAESPGRLVDLLGSEDEAVRAGAAQKLEALGGEAVEELRLAIQYCKPRTATLATEILTRIEQHRSPEVLAALRQSLMKPKTCRFTVRVVIDFAKDLPQHHATAKVFLSGADKVRVDSTAKIRMDRDVVRWVCNGTSAFRQVDDGDWVSIPAPTAVRQKTVDAVLGLSGPGLNSWTLPAFQEDSSKGFRLVGPVVSTFQEPEAGLRVEVDEHRDTPAACLMKGTLTYDPATFLPRTSRWSAARTNPKAPNRGLISVTYEDVVLNADLEETLFSP